MPVDADRVEQVFNQAVMLDSPEGRAALLARACGDDAELRQRVEALLAAHDRTGMLRMSFTAAETAVTEAQGTTIGRYKLLEPIGEGGFGVVFMAEQEEPVRRRVALKIIKLGMDTRQVVARFEAERQALAMMDHPNVARVFDGGATETGRPYFVMELVKGVPITTYCDQHNLSIRQRLELFEQVCRAVQHAHQKGIIHRDLKPNNVLVGEQDDHPIAKVIDFGIAKATQARLTEKTLFTRFDQWIGTPQYMSPEQAGGLLDIDTRSDVYSLGVLLYELLAGATPFTAKELREKGYGEIQRIIRETEPPRPSTRLSSLGGGAVEVAKRRQTDLAALEKQLRGELEWIPLKAMRKDRTQRYGTASELGEDVRNYLDQKPLVAGPESATYRARKFLRRNKRPVGVAAAVLLMLVAGITGTTLGLIGQSRQRAIADAARRDAEAQRNEARRQAEEARRQADTAEAVQRFTAEMLRLPAVPGSPEWVPGLLPMTRRTQVPTVLEVMSAAMKQLDAGELKTEPSVEVGVRTLIGHALREFGRSKEEESNLRKALALSRTALPADERNIADLLDRLGELLVEQRKPAQAEPMFHEAMEIRRRITPKEEHKLGHERTEIEFALMDEGKFAEAEPLLREDLERRRKARPAGHPDLLNAIRNLATILRAQRKLDEAESLFIEALAIERSALPDHDKDIAGTVKDLAWVKHDQGKFAEAEPLFVEALAKFESALGKDSWEVADTRLRLGSTLAALNRRAEAEVALLEAERVISKSKGVPAWSQRQCLKALVELYAAWDKAEPGKGYDAKARQWSEKLPASRPSTNAPPG